MDVIYQKLPIGEDGFRLICIDTSDPDLHLECRMSVNKSPSQRPWDPFIAVSYTWGGQPFSEVIKVNGVKTAVTRSCLEVLTALKSRGEKIWIDQLCIDQVNLAERGAQILLMHKIYAAANEVIIWLDCFERLVYPIKDRTTGHSSTLARDDALMGRVSNKQDHNQVGWASVISEDELAKETVQLIEYLTDEIPTGMIRDTTSGSKPIIATRTVVWERVLGIIQHRYFRRRWTIQEITQNPKANILLGSESVPYQTIRKLSSVLINPQLFIDNMEMRLIKDALTDFQTEHGLTVSCISDVGSLRAHMAGSDHGPRTPGRPSLVWLLVHSIDFETTELHDRIFSLRPLSSQRDLLPFPDYSLSYEDIALNHASRLVELREGPEMILLAGLHCDQNFNAPTWCPSWGPDLFPIEVYDVGQSKQKSGNGRYPAAAARSEPKMAVSQDCRHLTIEGCIAGPIQALFANTRSHDTREWFWDAWRFVPQHSQRPFLNSERVRNLTNEVRKLRKGARLFEIDRRELASLQTRFRRIDRALSTLFLEQNAVLKLVKEAGNAELFDSEYYSQDSIFFSSYDFTNHHLCIMERGFVGIVPDISRVGDSVAIFHGVDFPMVIRRQEDGQYQLIGSAYFLDLSHGEIFDLDFYKPENIVLI